MPKGERRGEEAPSLDWRRIEIMDEAMAEVLRRKTPAERLQIGFGLWRSARKLLRGSWRRCIRSGIPNGLSAKSPGGSRMELYECPAQVAAKSVRPRSSHSPG